MAEKLKVAVIGCGRPWQTEGATGFGMAHQHVIGLLKTDKCELVATCDLKTELAEAMLKDHGSSGKAYEKYEEMMEQEKPDIVCISLWPHLHAQVVCDVVAHKPKAIHCEKPMDIHWDGSLKMHEECEKAGIQLTINHQRRFNKPLLKAREMIKNGELGELKVIEGAWHNFQDSGTHALDTMFYFNGDEPAEWALGQIDMRGGKRVFGALQEGQGIVTFKFKNGVRGTMFSGKDYKDIGCLVRVVGDKGVLELLEDEPWLRVLDFAKGEWQVIDTGEGIHDNAAGERSMASLVECLESGEKHLMSSENALRPTEIIFAAYESSKRRARVDLPLPAGKCAMLEMVESGELQEDKQEVKK